VYLGDACFLDELDDTIDVILTLWKRPLWEFCSSCYEISIVQRFNDTYVETSSSSSESSMTLRRDFAFGVTDCQISIINLIERCNNEAKSYLVLGL
jgi:hypothetical protein